MSTVKGRHSGEQWHLARTGPKKLTRAQKCVLQDLRDGCYLFGWLNGCPYVKRLTEVSYGIKCEVRLTSSAVVFDLIEMKMLKQDDEYPSNWILTEKGLKAAGQGKSPQTHWRRF